MELSGEVFVNFRKINFEYHTMIKKGRATARPFVSLIIFKR